MQAGSAMKHLLSYLNDETRCKEETEAGRTALLVFAGHKKLNGKEKMDNE